mgnify:CR=1 FL=1
MLSRGLRWITLSGNGVPLPPARNRLHTYLVYLYIHWETRSNPTLLSCMACASDFAWMHGGNFLRQGDWVLVGSGLPRLRRNPTQTQTARGERWGFFAVNVALGNLPIWLIDRLKKTDYRAFRMVFKSKGWITVIAVMQEVIRCGGPRTTTWENSQTVAKTESPPWQAWKQNDV